MRNIVLVTMDSVRADHCTFLGYERETFPNLTEMANNGICFKNAISPAPRTIPSIVSSFTGEPITQYFKCDSEWDFARNCRKNLEEKSNFVEKLSEMGYTTFGFSPNPWASSFMNFDRYFDYFQDFMMNQGIFENHLKGGGLMKWIRTFKNLLKKEEAFKSWDTYYDEIIEKIDSTKEPFFLWVFLLDTHVPYITPKDRKWTNFFDMYYQSAKVYRHIESKHIDFPKGEKQKVIDAYDDSLRYADKFIGKIKDDLRKHDPLFVVNSDHGEAFFERNNYGHFLPLFYEENVHVPLVVYDGAQTNNFGEPVSLLKLYDIMPGLGESSRSSLSSLVDDYALLKDFSFREGGTVSGVRIGKWKYINGQKKIINYCGSEEELYDLEHDPQENKNIVNEFPKITEELKKVLDKEKEKDRKELTKTEISKLRESNVI